MFIGRTVALCIGQFIRQELKYSLEKCSMTERAYELEPAVGMTSGYPSIVLERVILRLLDTFCDADTSAHARRLVYLATAVGERLALSVSDMSMLRQAALLHDIGKIGIPAAILRKPGALNAEEKAIMRRHPSIGRDLLLSCGGVLAPLASIVVAHHECWDGSGYPAGLVGNSIPLLARILAVVDSYDAMISDRPYGRPLSHVDACLELQCCVGRQYDPQVVAALLDVFVSPLSPVSSEGAINCSPYHLVQ